MLPSPSGAGLNVSWNRKPAARDSGERRMASCDREELARLAQLIEQWVDLDVECDAKARLRRKIDVLGRACEQLRIALRHVDNALEYDEFIRGQLEVTDDALHYRVATAPPTRAIEFTRPSQYQSKLLLFLLIYHRPGDRVIDMGCS